MANLVRRIVSGSRARFKDKHLDLELDLAYVTDQIIVMGFPATGVEGIYRNRREHAKKFLDHRHGKSYWIFNFCPLRENSYPASFFDGRVSRYPFPDHHAPPLAILPLFVRDVREWLSGSPDRVAVLHCKAGKGRSGTLACAYLLSLAETPTPPQLERSLTKKEWARQRANQIMETVETEEMNEETPVIEDLHLVEEREGVADIQEMLVADQGCPSNWAGREEEDLLKLRDASNVVSDILRRPSEAEVDFGMTTSPTAETNNAADVLNTDDTVIKPFSLEDVLALHTSRRMKSPSSPDKKLRHGVSVPSQRRWLHYWSQLLANVAPRDFWRVRLPRVRLSEIHVRVRELGAMKMAVLRMANQLIEKASGAKHSVQQRGRGPVWVSLARYDDEFVDMLENWERHTRSDDGDLARRGRDSEYTPESGAPKDVFAGGIWDKGKMIRSFARLGHFDDSPNTQGFEGGIVASYTLRPLTEHKWGALEEAMQERRQHPAQEWRKSQSPVRSSLDDAVLSTASSVTEVAVVGTSNASAEKGVILDASREVRMKIYMGQVFMGWFWFIPAFHMPPVPSSAASPGQSPPLGLTRFALTRKDVDFPIGAGAALVDVDVALDWIVPGLDTAPDGAGPAEGQTRNSLAK